MIPKGVGASKKREKFPTIAQYFTMGKSAQRLEPLLKGVGTRSTRCRKGDIQTPLSPPSPPIAT